MSLVHSVSSTNISVRECWRWSGRSLMYIETKSGPSILPSGMPEEIGRKFEFSLFMPTHWLRLARYPRNHLSKLPVMPKFGGLANSLWCDTVSNTLHISRYITSATALCSLA